MSAAGSTWHRTEDTGELHVRRASELCTEERQSKERTQRHGPHATVGPAPPTALLLVCSTCSRSFRRKQDIARHKCQTTRPRSRAQVNPTSESDQHSLSSVCHFVAEKHHLLGGFLSRFKVKVCVCVYICRHRHLELPT